MQPSVGQKAPGFTLFNADKEKVSLGDFKGRKVLLLFFPHAFSGVCTRELCNVRDNMAAYNNTGVQVLGISVDSLFTLNKFRLEHSLSFPLLSDFNKEVSAAYGTLYETFIFDMKGVSKRSAFIIDQDGVIRYAEVLENAGDLPDFERIIQVLGNLS